MKIKTSQDMPLTTTETHGTIMCRELSGYENTHSTHLDVNLKRSVALFNLIVTVSYQIQYSGEHNTKLNTIQKIQDTKLKSVKEIF